MNKTTSAKNLTQYSFETIQKPAPPKLRRALTIDMTYDDGSARAGKRHKTTLTPVSVELPLSPVIAALNGLGENQHIQELISAPEPEAVMVDAMKNTLITPMQGTTQLAEEVKVVEAVVVMPTHPVEKVKAVVVPTHPVEKVKAVVVPARLVEDGKLVAVDTAVVMPPQPAEEVKVVVTPVTCIEETLPTFDITQHNQTPPVVGAHDAPELKGITTSIVSRYGALPRLFPHTYSKYNRPRRNRSRRIPTRLWGTVYVCLEYPNGVYIDKKGVPRPEADMTLPKLQHVPIIPKDQWDKLSAEERCEQRNLRYDSLVKKEEALLKERAVKKNLMAETKKEEDGDDDDDEVIGGDDDDYIPEVDDEDTDDDNDDEEGEEEGEEDEGDDDDLEDEEEEDIHGCNVDDDIDPEDK